MSNYARLIQSEQVYKLKIRQLEKTIELQKKQIEYFHRILRQDLPAIEATEEVLEGEIVEDHLMVTTDLGWTECKCGYEPSSNQDAMNHIMKNP